MGIDEKFEINTQDKENIDLLARQYNNSKTLGEQHVNNIKALKYILNAGIDNQYGARLKYFNNKIITYRGD